MDILKKIELLMEMTNVDSQDSKREKMLEKLEEWGSREPIELYMQLIRQTRNGVDSLKKRDAWSILERVAEDVPCPKVRFLIRTLLHFCCRMCQNSS